MAVYKNINNAFDWLITKSAYVVLVMTVKSEIFLKFLLNIPRFLLFLMSECSFDHIIGPKYLIRMFPTHHSSTSWYIEFSVPQFISFGWSFKQKYINKKSCWNSYIMLYYDKLWSMKLLIIVKIRSLIIKKNGYCIIALFCLVALKFFLKQCKGTVITAIFAAEEHVVSLMCVTILIIE